jgi:hypothetical protein
MVPSLAIHKSENHAHGEGSHHTAVPYHAVCPRAVAHHASFRHTLPHATPHRTVAHHAGVVFVARVLLHRHWFTRLVFFPDIGVVSALAVYPDGRVIEMATIGREGCTGVQAFFGAKTSSVRLLVQIPGSAAKMSRATFAGAMESMPFGPLG